MREGDTPRAEWFRAPRVRTVVLGGLACLIMLIVGWWVNGADEAEAIEAIRKQLVAVEVPTFVIEHTLQPELVSDELLIGLSPGQIELVREAFYQVRGEISTRDLVRHVLIICAVILGVVALATSCLFWLVADIQDLKQTDDSAGDLDDTSETTRP